MHFKWYAAIVVALALGYPSLCLAEDDPQSIIGDVILCQEITDSSQRLECFDGNVRELQRVRDAKEIIVVSRENLAKSRRNLFGFPSSDAPFVNGGSEAEEEKIEELTTTIKSVGGGEGHYVLTLENGAVWEQSESGYMTEPKSGESIVIKRAILGNYMARISGRPAFRIKRRR
ncbi:hypothetical protein F7D01_03280 [Erythrobacter sp. 3-20A1M]|uniref:hypothetical protein n=1 Tax=Erythrobacter sp. 3-20A1M TaxID=2653850 RepID=UPI001BFCBD2A|nr:hypothetical protein [Erythrobacter sp. 3-20A1M]QWC56240.1 hypothetical protein F7D01_03280 [Erythrobacter sp. 3-20A1M]